MRVLLRVLNVFLVFAYFTAPPDCSLTRQSETAGRDLGVWDSGAEPFRLQKIA